MVPAANMYAERPVRLAIADADRAAALDFVLLVVFNDRPQLSDQFAAAWHLFIKVAIVWEVAIGVFTFKLSHDRDAFAGQGGEGHLGFAKRV